MKMLIDEILFEERLKSFQPEPLVPMNDNNDESIELSAVKEVANNVDLAKVNYLNFLTNDEIKKVSGDAIRKYGMGTCGPRGFFGTTDAHLELEERLAKFLRVENASIVSSGFVALSTAFTSSFKPDHTVFVDELVNLPIQQSVEMGQSKIITFEHNDAKNFRQKVLQLKKEQKNSSGKFIVILEAISWNTGKMCPLPDFLAVAEEFKIRIFLEESYSLGVLGPTGRGLTEHFDVDPKRIDSIFGTLEGALGSIGGFYTSCKEILGAVQALLSPGYTFSASGPTYLAKGAVKALDLLEDKPEKFSRLTKEFHTFLKEVCGFDVVSDPQSPFKLIKNKPQDNHKVHKYCKEKGVHFICSENGLIIHPNISLLEDKEKLEWVYEVFKEASSLIH